MNISCRPINVVCWRRALCLEILEKVCYIDFVMAVLYRFTLFIFDLHPMQADVLEYYDQVISSPSRPFAIPAVLRVS